MATTIAEGIEADPAVRFGRPVVAGTRVPVDLVLSKLAGGMTYAEVSAEYGIPSSAIRAVLAHAADVLAAERVRTTRYVRRRLIDEDMPRTTSIAARDIANDAASVRDGAHSP